MKRMAVLEYLTEKGVIAMKKRVPYETCKYCGAHLDFGELCDCRTEEKENSTHDTLARSGAINQ